MIQRLNLLKPIKYLETRVKKDYRTYGLEKHEHKWILKVYSRTNKNRDGKVKTQLFTTTNNNQCIGRVWDSRRGGKVIDNGCKLPIGYGKKVKQERLKEVQMGNPGLLNSRY